MEELEEANATAGQLGEQCASLHAESEWLTSEPMQHIENTLSNLFAAFEHGTLQPKRDMKEFEEATATARQLGEQYAASQVENEGITSERMQHIGNTLSNSFA